MIDVLAVISQGPALVFIVSPAEALAGIVVTGALEAAFL